MGSLIAAYTFNSGAGDVYDYSANKLPLAAHNITYVGGRDYSSTIPVAAKFGSGALSYMDTPLSVAGISAFSMFLTLNITTLPTGSNKAYLAFKSGSFALYINSSGNIIFTIYNSATAYTLTSATALTTATWYTIAAIWDGTTLYLWFNATEDSNTLAAAFGSIDDAGNQLYLGNDTKTDSTNYFKGILDNIQFRNIALLPQDIIVLNYSPEGVLYSCKSHPFAVGDCITDETLAAQAVVTYVPDAQHYYAFPLTPPGHGGYKRIGNIYNSLRQCLMEFWNDYDGNGNPAITIKCGITAFTDYAFPPGGTQKWDCNGMTGIKGELCKTWFSEYQPRYTTEGSLTSLYQETLIPASLGADGGWVKFSYTVLPANNSNSKSLKVVFANFILLTISVATNSAALICIEGTLKMTSLMQGNWFYKISYWVNGTAPTGFTTGTLTRVNEAIDANKLILQGQGVVNADLTAIQGEGVINPIAAFS